MPGPSPKTTAKKGRSHPVLVLGIIGLAAVVLIVVIVAATGSSGPKGPQTVKGSVATDIQEVEAGVEAVMTQLGIVIQDNGAQSDLNALAQLADQEHTSLTNLKDQIAVDVPLNNAGGALTNAANELKNSMAAMGTYIGNPNAATLASFNNQFQTALSDWNDAVGQIYSGTTSGPGPTIPAG
jgi:hypothetical protein